MQLEFWTCNKLARGWEEECNRIVKDFKSRWCTGPTKWHQTLSNTMQNFKQRYGDEFMVKRHELKRKLMAQGYRCGLTGRPLEVGEVALDHIIPRKKGGGHETGNLHWVCRDANKSKHTLTLDEFTQLCFDHLIHMGYTVHKG